MKQILLLFCSLILAYTSFAQSPVTITYSFDNRFDGQTTGLSSSNIIYPQRAIIGGTKLNKIGTVIDDTDRVVAQTVIDNNNATNYKTTFFRFDIHTASGVKFKINKISVIQKSEIAGDPNAIDEEGNGDTYRFRIGTALNGATPDNTDSNQSSDNILFSDQYTETEYIPGEGFNYAQNKESISVYLTGRGERVGGNPIPEEDGGGVYEDDKFNWFVDQVVIEGEYVQGLNLPNFKVEYAFNQNNGDNTDQMKAVSSNPNKINGTEAYRQKGSSQNKKENTFTLVLADNDNNLGYSPTNRTGLAYSLVASDGYKAMIHNYQYKVAGSGEFGSSRAHRTAVYRDATRDGAGIKVDNNHFEFGTTILAGLGVWGESVKGINYASVFFKDNFVFDGEHSFLISANRTGNIDGTSQKERITFDHLTIRGTIIPTNAYSLVQELLAGQDLFINAEVGEGKYSQEAIDRYITTLQAGVDFAFDESKTPEELERKRVEIEALNQVFVNNSKPTANVASYTTNINEDLSITLEGSDSSDDKISYIIIDQSGNGILSGDLPQLTYSPNTDFEGEDTFTFKTFDGIEYSDVATISVTVEGLPNTAPVANTGTATVTSGETVEITLTGSDTDEDMLSYIIVSQPENGILSGEAPNVTYTPDADFVGEDTFTFKVNDGTEDSETVTVIITVEAAAPVNTAPVANTGTITVTSGETVDITLSGSDADEDILSYIIVSQPENGTLSGEAPNVTYTPDADFVGEDTFTFKVNDGTEDSGTATVTITVEAAAPVNTAPVANAVTAKVTSGETVDITLSGSDADEDILSYMIVSQPENGTLSGEAPNVTYTPDADFVGEDTFTFKVNDGTEDSGTVTVTITVEAPQVTNIDDHPTPSLSLKTTLHKVIISENAQENQQVLILIMDLTGNVLFEETVIVGANSTFELPFRFKKNLLYLLSINGSKDRLMNKVLFH
ncbi:Ig-like domain-containing protein [Flammeovirga agarivorans]|uniref:Tandem-95 repeat protein n=1 Tax=Flammeovirga agarivorans TaxID=2726742 RepID=A0A7X8XXU5_9BACT|nr:Ig-like domain-containing protein [Flammeovirga agarivorans]NLR93453.1 tandem-95 repeat protein [Flammeovirga agarivorans]